MLDFNDIFQLLMLLMIGIITGIEIYFLITKIKMKSIDQNMNKQQHINTFVPPPIPSLRPTPYNSVA